MLKYSFDYCGPEWNWLIVIIAMYLLTLTSCNIASQDYVFHLTYKTRFCDFF